MSLQPVWNNCLEFIKDNIQEQAYKTWFEPIQPVKLDDNILSIQVPSKFFYEWLEEHYVKLLKMALTKELGKDAKLVYVIRMENSFGSTKSKKVFKPVGEVTFISPFNFSSIKSIPAKYISSFIRSFAIIFEIFISLLVNLINFGFAPLLILLKIDPAFGTLEI